MRQRHVLVLGAVLAAACGGPSSPPSRAPASNAPPGVAPGASSSAGAPGPGESASASPAATGATPAHGGPAAGPANAPKPEATALAAQLGEIGLDAKALPPLNKLSPEQLRKVMRTFTKALGVSCDGCHDTKDFRAPTPHKKIATHMWNDFTRRLVAAPNGEAQALYCDSCHGGRAEFLDRTNVSATSDWMQANYVDKLKRVDGKDHGCETCHGDPMEPKIFAKLWK